MAAAMPGSATATSAWSANVIRSALRRAAIPACRPDGSLHVPTLIVRGAFVCTPIPAKCPLPGGHRAIAG